MSQTPSTDTLYTVVRNTSGGERFFGFLGQHGMRLADDEQVSVRGNLVATLGASSNARKFAALEDALTEGDLELVNTPAPVLYDAGDDRTVQLAVQGGCLGIVDAGWVSSGDSDFSEPNCS